MKRRLRTRGFIVALAIALVVATAGGAVAAFVAIKTNSSTLASATDWLPPVIDSAVLGSTSGVAGEHLRNGSTYYAYANVAVDRGNPASGVASVTADLSSVTSGQSAVTLTAGSYSHAGVSYNYRSASLTANLTPGPCQYSAQVTARDAASPVNSSTRNAVAPLSDRDLLTDYNIRMDGPSAGDKVGYAEPSVAGVATAGAGDVNNDGLDDVIVGNYNADNNAKTDSGSAYVIFGRTTTTAIDLANLGTNGFRIDGAAAGDAAGYAVSGAGDVNNDGYHDVIVTAWKADNTAADSGSAYVVFGSANPVNVDLASLAATAGYRIDGQWGSGQFGSAAANAGDVDRDGRSDVVIGEMIMDRAYVIFGKSDGATVQVSQLTTYSPAKGYLILGPGVGSTGAFVAAAGDINNDGMADVLVSAPFADNNGRVNSGSVYVVHGKTTSATIDLATYTGGFRIDGQYDGEAVGTGVASADDVNGDGIPDVLITGMIVYGGGASSGVAYVIFGKNSNNVAVDLASLGSQGYRIIGGAASDYVNSIAGIGDVNADGRGDALIGAFGVVANGRSYSGTGYVVFGKTDTTEVNLGSLGTQGYLLAGAAAGDLAGKSASNVGDVNGDGRTDFLIGAETADNNGRTDSGSVYVVYGPECGTHTYASMVKNTPGLVGHWPLSETSGSTAYDSKKSNNGTYTNGPTLGASGAINSGDEAVSLDGTDDNVNLGNPAAFQVSTGTIEAWVNAPTPGAGHRAIMAKAYAYYLYLNGGVLVTWDQSSGTERSTGVNLADGQWHHVALTFRSGVVNGTKVYIDGVLSLTTTTTMGNQLYDLSVGSTLPGWSQNLKGTIDEPAIYNRILKLTEIANHFNVGNASGCAGYAATVSCTPGLLSHWRLGETSGTTAVDAKGSNNGTYRGGVTLGAGGPVGTDKAVALDGVNDDVNLGNPATFQATTGTIETWVKTTSPGGWVRTIMAKPSAYGILSVDGVLSAFDWGTSSVRSSGVNIADGKWHHVALSYQSGVAGGTKLYLDGRLVLTTTTTFFDGTFYDLYLGSNDGNSYYFNGSIDEAAIYNRVLTPTEIADHSSARDECSTYRDTVQCTSGLQHYYRLGESSGTSAVDAKGSMNGTYVGSPTLGSTGALPRDPDTAATFDGTDDSVDLTNLTVNTTAGAYNTVEFWMYWDGTEVTMPFGFMSYDLFFWSGHFGFNTGVSDMWGVSNAGLANRWVHVAAQFYNGDGTRSRLWIDGAEQILTQAAGTTAARIASSGARVGGAYGGAGYRFPGRLDEVAIYNRALTTSEILAHYLAR